LIEFELNLEDHLFKLHYDLKNNNYRHGGYFSFFVQDPKRRHIHKASVRDRVLHHAIVRVIEPIFEKAFIYDSWSCRQDKGTHKAVDRLQDLARKASQNNTRNLWTLKLDIQKFFDSVDHGVLLSILYKKIPDVRTRQLLTDIVESFSPGMPLGNLTSQLFANVYMNELDQFIKHELKVKSYLRYSDDFALLHTDEATLRSYIPPVRDFLNSHLKLNLHERKIILGKYRSGIDFLGYVCFPNFRVIRTRTKKRMLRKVKRSNFVSYSGVLKHCRASGLRKTLLQKLRSQKK
jgi:RNA-directed DNA polymerase